MSYYKEVQKIISKVQDRETAINTINDCFGWFTWFVEFEQYKEECVPELSKMSDEDVMDIARRQLLVHNEEYLQYLHHQDLYA